MSKVNKKHFQMLILDKGTASYVLRSSSTAIKEQRCTSPSSSSAMKTAAC
jgi:hypothetical protein